MEANGWEEKYIQSNMTDLIKYTDCNAQFLLEIKHILSRDDESVLEATLRSRGSMAQTKLLYDIAVTRVDMYVALTKALFRTNQTKAFDVLLQGLVKHDVANVFKRCEIEEFKKVVLKKLVKFQRQEVELEKILELLKTEVVENLMDKYLRGKFLDDLINDKHPILISNNVPEQLSYYIDRHLTARNRLNREVLQKKCGDVFVIRNIQPYELHALSNHPTDMSGNQIHKLTTRFIVLEYDDHFIKICNATNDPVHLLHHLNGKLIWERTHGDVTNLHCYIHEDQEELHENSVTDTASGMNSVICISDSPGMGKTMLLVSLANRIMDVNPDRLVRFIILQEFVTSDKVMQAGGITVELLINVIADQAAESEIGKQIFKELLISENVIVDIFFDGFDEILQNQLENAKAILSTIVKLKSARIYVATRPHMREELETTLGVLGYKMLGLRVEEQVEFLQKYWEQKQANPNKLLQEFAKHCLKTLKKSMNDFEQDFAGIPMQCKLLAEVFQDKAINFSKPDSRQTLYNTGMDIRISSIFEMYKKLVKMRFKKIRSAGNTKNYVRFLLHTHMYASLQLLFPEVAPEFQYILIGCSDDVLMNKEICSIGILEKYANDASPRFVHRTFAEYFVGRFIVYMLDKKKHPDRGFEYFSRKPFLVFLFDKILSTWSSTEKMLSSSKLCDPPQIQSHSFHYPVIVYFIDAHLKNSQVACIAEAWTCDVDKLHAVLIACARQDSVEVFTQLSSGIHAKLIREDASRLASLFLLSTKYSNLEFLKSIQPIISCCGKQDIHVMSNQPQFKITPLHIAAERGHYAISEFIVNEGICSKDLRYVIHTTVPFSYRQSVEEISQRSQIIRLLININEAWVNESTPNGTSPLLQPKVHLKLLECLIESGADVNAVNSHGCVLHRLTENKITPLEYQKSLVFLLKNKFDKFNTLDILNRTPLHLALQNLEVLGDVVEVFHMFKTKFNAIDAKGDSVMFYAIQAGRSVSLIQKLMSFGADSRHTNSSGENVLHVCAKYGNYQAFEYFMSTREIDKNKVVAVNNNGLTPFLQALAYGKGLTINIIKLMEDKGLSITSQLASEALKFVMCNNIVILELDKHFVQVADYLIEKGGILTFRYGENPWNLEATKKNLKEIKKATQCNFALLEELRKRGVPVTNTMVEYNENLMKLLKDEGIINNETALFEDRTNSFYEALQKNENTFERLCVSLVSCGQITPFMILKQCVVSEMQDSVMFVTLANKLLQFIHSKRTRVVILKSWNIELSIRRIKDMIDPNIKVVIEGNGNIENSKSSMAVHVFKKTTNCVIEALLASPCKSICLCTHVSDDVKEVEVILDELCWEDLSNDFRSHLVSLMHVCSTIDDFPSDYSHLKNEVLLDLLKEYQIDFIGFNRDKILDDGIYLSTTILNYFISDKLLFYDVEEEEINKLKPFGHRVGEVGDNLQILDFIILKDMSDYEMICEQTSGNLHLIQYNNGSLKKIRTRGFDSNIQNFIENVPSPQKQCTLIPVCVCGNHFLGSENFIWSLFRFPEKGLNCWINILDLISLKTELRLNDLKDVKLMLETACIGKNSDECWKALKRAMPSVHLKTEMHAPLDVLLILGCTEHECRELKQVAVNTLFPQTCKPNSMLGLDKFRNLNVLTQYNDILFFKHVSLAWYFIAELVTCNEGYEFVNVNDIISIILKDCFEFIHEETSFSWWNETAFTKKNVSVRFVATTFFFYINLLFGLRKTQTLDSLFINHVTPMMTKDFAYKWIHACVYGNYENLLSIFVDLEAYNKVFEMEDIVFLAVKYADVPILDFVAKRYAQPSKLVRDIQLDFEFSDDNCNYTTSILHVAALRGNLMVVQYLIEKQGFKSMLNEESIRVDILKFCVSDTNKDDYQISERKEILDYLLRMHSTLLEETKGNINSPLLVPNVHVDLVIHLINYGIDVDTCDKNSQNLLHLCPEYMSPADYDKLLRHLNCKGRIDLIHSLDTYKYTPLHIVARCLELLDSSFELIKSAEFDFNAIDKYGNTPLVHASMYSRSAKFLDLLIRSGAYIGQRCQYSRTVLHTAAEVGNLTAMRYLISQGSDVNVKDENALSPLHLALTFHDQVNKNDIIEMLKVLIHYNADVNAKTSEDKTPLHYAVREQRIVSYALEIIKLFIENNADPDAVDKYGRCFLHCAPYTFTSELYNELIVYINTLSRTSTFTIIDYRKMSLLHCAVENFDPLFQTLEIFRSNKIDFNGLDIDGDSVVFDAIEGGRNAKCLEELFKFGADWKILNKRLETALNHSARKNNLSAFKLFLNFGCDVNSKDIYGRTSLHNVFLGTKCGEKIMAEHQIVSELLNHGADVNVLDEDSKLPIAYASEGFEIGNVANHTIEMLRSFNQMEVN